MSLAALLPPPFVASRVRLGPHKSWTALAPLLAAMLCTPAADAADRSPVQRQTLVEIAYVLGQSHALRQACAGADDLYWRQRMLRMIEVEVPDQDFSNRLTTSFNAGYAAGQQAHPRCDARVRTDTAAAAARGRRLAASLATPGGPPT